MNFKNYFFFLTFRFLKISNFHLWNFNIGKFRGDKICLSRVFPLDEELQIAVLVRGADNLLRLELIGEPIRVVLLLEPVQLFSLFALLVPCTLNYRIFEELISGVFFKVVFKDFSKFFEKIHENF